MQSSLSHFWLTIVGALLCVMGLDLATKQWATLQGRVVSQNEGISFGLLPQLEAWWMVIALVALAALVWWGWQSWQKIPIAVGLVIGGGMANVADRLMTGAVRDWLAVPFLGVYNNLADWAIFFALLWFFSVQFERK